MNIKWKKMGRIFVPSGEGFFKTHATRPIPIRWSEKTLRILFSSRDDDDRPLANFIDVNIDNPSEIFHYHDEPLMELGRIGTFDDSGIVPVSVLEESDCLSCYYVGWKRRRINVTFESAIGLAYIKKNFSCERVFEGPILAQDKDHPVLTAGPFVLKEDDLFKMWYCSGTEWRICDTGPEPIYRVHYAESTNGIDWVPHPKPCIDYKFDGEVISAPWVIKINSEYHMWYSIRGSSTREAKNYTIGYATSDNGLDWQRKDEEVGIERSNEGWDSEMICYPSFYSHKDLTYMFYSGNAVGKGGIGYAVAQRFF